MVEDGRFRFVVCYSGSERRNLHLTPPNEFGNQKGVRIKIPCSLCLFDIGLVYVKKTYILVTIAYYFMSFRTEYRYILP
jgi:hypothetical protein